MRLKLKQKRIYMMMNHHSDITANKKICEQHFLSSRKFPGVFT